MPAGYFISTGRSLGPALARVNLRPRGVGEMGLAALRTRGLTVLLTLSPGDG
jgi:hypothetical protein